MHFTNVVSTALLAASAVVASPTKLRRDGGNDKVVAYWGNTGAASGNIPISEICANPSVDIVILSFLTEFPDQREDGVPVLNFGNACGGTFENGLLNCPFIAEGIAECKDAGKEILLSLGGAFPGNQAFASAQSAKDFAKWLWETFGSDLTLSETRPFGEQVIDGVDLDIESNVALDQRQIYFPEFVEELREQSNQGWKIGAAPQCVIPDSHFSEYIQTSWFDYIFLQLYNTDGCSARDLVDTPLASTNTFSKWLNGELSSTTGYLNDDIKVFAGLPGSTLGSTGTESGARFYITPNEVKELVAAFYTNPSFGGISIWDATYDSLNQICEKPFSYWAKKALDEMNSGNFAPFPSSCSVSSSSVIHSSTSSVVHASSSSVVHASSSSSVVHASPTSSAVHDSPSSSAAGGPIHPSSTSSRFPSSGPFTNSTSSASHIGGPRPTSSVGGGSGPVSSSRGGHGGPGYGASSSSYGYGGPGYGSSSSGGYGYPHPTATETSTSTYVDICPTGLTTKTHTWTRTCYEGDDDSTSTSEVPYGWTTTVTVCNVCGPKPTTVTLTTPCSTPVSTPAQPTGNGKPTTTLVVIVTPVPESEYWNYVNNAKPTTSSSTPVSPVNGGSYGSWPVDSDASPKAGSSAVAKPVAEYSPANAASWPLGTGAPGSKTSGTYAAQFTGAASKMNVGAGLFAGLAVAALAL